MATLPSTSLVHAEVRMRGVSAAAGGSSKPIEFISHWRRTANVLPVSNANIGAAFAAGIIPTYTGALNVRYTASGCDVRFIDDATDAYITTADSTAGAVTGDSLADYSAAVIQLHTAYRGRSGRGSVHLGPMSESDVTGDVLVSAGITRVNAFISALAAGFTDSDGNVWVQQVFSRTLSQVSINPTAVVVNDVVSRLLNLTTGTMRRRKVRTVN